VSSFPYSEGFESGLGSWTQATNDNINWTRTSGATPSGQTGPSSASEGSNYLFVEASVQGTGYPNAQAVLNSPCFNLASVSSANFNFKYHMYGDADMGTFSLEVTTNGTTWTSIWSQTGNKGDNWLDASVSLAAYNGQVIKLRFNRTTGSTWKADIAIDAISLSSSAPADKCAGVAAYVSGQSYSVGDRVTFQGDLYERTASAWSNLGACGTARIEVRETVNSLDRFEFSIYPNPLKGDILYVKSNTSNIDFVIVNMLGQQVAKGNTTNKSVDVNNLESGMYLIQFNVNNTIETRKFIKQ
jgi:hypothetical protein